MIRKLAVLITLPLVCINSAHAWYIPCFCGCGLPIEYMFSVQHSSHYPLETQKTAKFAELLANGMSQLQSLVKTYNNIKDAYDTIGQARNLASTFDFNRIWSTWEINDWDDLKDWADSVKSATKGWENGSASGTLKGSPTESSFLGGFLGSLTDLTKEANTDLNSLELSLREANSLTSDSIIRAILAQEKRNAQTKARSAAVSQQVKTDKNTVSAAGGGIEGSYVSISDRAESAAVNKAQEVMLWNDMTSAINRSTYLRINALHPYIETKRAKLINDGKPLYR